MIFFSIYMYLYIVDVFRNSGPFAIQTEPYEKHRERHDSDCTDIEHAKLSK